MKFVLWLVKISYRTTKTFMQRRLLLREKESDKGCSLFLDLLPPMRYKMRCWTHRWLTTVWNLISWTSITQMRNGHLDWFTRFCRCEQIKEQAIFPNVSLLFPRIFLLKLVQISIRCLGGKVWLLAILPICLLAGCRLFSC